MNKRYFLTKKTVHYILLVGDWEVTNVARIARKVNMTFHNALKITNYLQDLGIITAPKRGRIRKIELTEEGKEIYISLKKISNIVNLYNMKREIS